MYKWKIVGVDRSGKPKDMDIRAATEADAIDMARLQGVMAKRAYRGAADAPPAPPRSGPVTKWKIEGTDSSGLLISVLVPAADLDDAKKIAKLRGINPTAISETNISASPVRQIGKSKSKAGAKFAARAIEIIGFSTAVAGLYMPQVRPGEPVYTIGLFFGGLVMAVIGHVWHRQLKAN